jgi:methionyl-tRNA formyltransferase
MGQELTALPRVVFLSSGGILGDAVLERLLSCGKFEVVGVVRSRRVMIRGAGFLRGALAYFARCGIPYTVYIWTITTFAEFVGFATGTGSITARARRVGIQVLHSADINSPAGHGFIEALRPDLLVTAHFDQKIYPPLCDRPGLAAINIHPSPLPLFRGLEPVLHAMLENEKTLGATVHRLVESIDAGAVVESEKIQADPRDSVLRSMRRLMILGVELLVNCTPAALAFGNGRPQCGPESYRSWPTARQVRRLYFSGKQLLKIRDLPLFWRCP